GFQRAGTDRVFGHVGVDLRRLLVPGDPDRAVCGHRLARLRQLLFEGGKCGHEEMPELGGARLACRVDRGARRQWTDDRGVVLWRVDRKDAHAWLDAELLRQRRSRAAWHQAPLWTHTLSSPAQARHPVD